MAETSEVFRVGLLGHGTVGAAFAALLEERAGAVAATTGLRPELAGVLTRSKGDFESILENSDLVVELMGGTDPARDLVLDAMRAGRPVVTANKQLLAKHCESGDVLVRDAELPDPRPGDVIVTPATGAYGYALANNYNGQPRPPVVFCSGGRSRVVVRRETYEELHGRDV